MIDYLKIAEEFKTAPVTFCCRKKLKSEQYDFIFSFLEKNSSSNPDELMFKINRLFIDQEKPKKYLFIMEYLAMVASKAWAEVNS